jgi:hypothetical protein
MRDTSSNTHASTQKTVQPHNISAQIKDTFGKGTIAQQQQVKCAVMGEVCMCIAVHLELCEKSTENVQGTVCFLYMSCS